MVNNRVSSLTTSYRQNIKATIELLDPINKEVITSSMDNALFFAFTNSGSRRAKIIRRVVFYFNKDQKLIFSRDKINLPLLGTKILRDDQIAFGL